MYLFVKLNSDALRGSRSRVVEKEDLTLLDTTQLAALLDKKLRKNTCKVCTLKKRVPIPGVK